MRVTEVFYSLQGEGMLAGVPSVFVRLAGCPFRCRWCDTAYAWDYAAGEDLSPDQIIEQVNRWPCRFVVLTGGEPMTAGDLSARPGLADLTQRLAAHGKHITIETAGALFLPDLACDLMSISPKLTNSGSCHGSVTGGHQANRLDVETLRRLIHAYPYQLKFVVESPEDVTEVQGVLGGLGELAPERVMLMPQGTTTEELLSRSPLIADLCKQTGLRFGPRLHVLLWGCRRGV
ncbi:MAG: 7-carboxy-7-deazaguanine synthase QueE [Phycisphaerae bacterium]|nr:7-carboxy-7-deazaguanine synthase QueE [Phycisphaerae bacterium]